MNAHNIQFLALSPHNGEYWYECVKCSERDWISSYGTLEQLNFYNKECAKYKKLQNSLDTKRIKVDQVSGDVTIVAPDLLTTKVQDECANLVDHILREGGGTWGDAIRDLRFSISKV